MTLARILALVIMGSVVCTIVAGMLWQTRPGLSLAALRRRVRRRRAERRVCYLTEDLRRTLDRIEAGRERAGMPGAGR